MKVIFLDRDGTIIVEPPDEQVDSLEKLEFLPGALSGLRLLAEAGFSLVMVTNQDNLGTHAYPRQAFDLVQQKLLRLLEGEGVRFDAVFICPHGAQEGCACRKPKTGLVTEYLERHAIDREHSFVIGDRETDVVFGRQIGVRTIRLTDDDTSEAEYRTGDFADACRYVLRSERTAALRRKTTETDISVRVALDGIGSHEINTGLGFFDHMLTQLARHSGIDMTIVAQGDLHIDEHHTMEDMGLALGDAIRQALGSKAGIGRFGFAVPMDESLAHVTLDLSGRPFLVFHASFVRERVGELPTELVEDFFRAFADGLRANLHVSVRGRNDHHKIEALFKATALALRQAVARNSGDRSLIPSTKGVL
ncbi:MAG: bifunctional histidinol-phosphatase/imidazoleglycerol-phosphate dehydratase HisB [Bacteroidota bacterium]